MCSYNTSKLSPGAELKFRYYIEMSIITMFAIALPFFREKKPNKSRQVFYPPIFYRRGRRDRRVFIFLSSYFLSLSVLSVPSAVYL